MPTIIAIDFDLTHRKEKVKNSVVTLEKTHQIITRFLTVYENIGRTRTTRRNQTEEQTDILRAMFVFSASGLDSVVKQLIKDCLEAVVRSSEGAQLQMKNFLMTELKDKETVNIGILADLLSTPSPFDKGTKLLKNELIDKSLQSAEQLLSAGAYFDVKSTEITNNIPKLKEVFKSRNQIIHEMDIVDITSIRRRRGRPLRTMCEYTNLMLETANKFITAVESKLI